jgi:arylsulfatase
MDAQRRARKPFFAYIATNAPHDPYVARTEDAELFTGRVPSKTVANFFGMIHNIDDNIGRLLVRLDEWNIARDTLVVFMNDNGGTAGTRVFNAGMRGGKGTAWIGGTRASSFWRWPGTLKPGDAGALSAHIDFFPTIAEIAGARSAADVAKQAEGRSLVPLLEDPARPLPDRALFTHLGRWPKFADPGDYKFKRCGVRNTAWHMVSDTGGREPVWQLFDMKTDYGEQKDVAAQHPEVVRELAGAYNRWWDSILPMLVNEKVVGPPINPFKERFYRQFGGSPTPEDLRKMDPNRPPR